MAPTSGSAGQMGIRAGQYVERVTGIEPAWPAWKSGDPSPLSARHRHVKRTPCLLCASPRRMAGRGTTAMSDSASSSAAGIHDGRRGDQPLATEFRARRVKDGHVSAPKAACARTAVAGAQRRRPTAGARSRTAGWRGCAGFVAGTGPAPLDENPVMSAPHAVRPFRRSPRPRRRHGGRLRVGTG